MTDCILVHKQHWDADANQLKDIWYVCGPSRRTEYEALMDMLRFQAMRGWEPPEGWTPGTIALPEPVERLSAATGPVGHPITGPLRCTIPGLGECDIVTLPQFPSPAQAMPDPIPAGAESEELVWHRAGDGYPILDPEPGPTPFHPGLTPRAAALAQGALPTVIPSLMPGMAVLIADEATATAFYAQIQGAGIKHLAAPVTTHERETIFVLAMPETQVHYYMSLIKGVEYSVLPADQLGILPT